MSDDQFGAEYGISPAQARDLPLDSHLHTDLSPDSDVPIDAFCAAAVHRGIREIAITDHIDFDPRDPAYGYADYEVRVRQVREAADRWAARGLQVRFGAELTFNRRWEDEVRVHLQRHRYDFTIGSVHDWPDSPYRDDARAAWIAATSLPDVVGPYFAEVAGAARSGLFDTIGHFDVVKRYLHPHVSTAALAAAPELFDEALQAVVDSGTALEVNSSGLRHEVGETYPAEWVVRRYRQLGGRAVTVGSDAHRENHFAFGLDVAYRQAARAGFKSLAFRRGAEGLRIPIPDRFRT